MSVTTLMLILVGIFIFSGIAGWIIDKYVPPRGRL